jgi:nitrogen regulatory protein PII
MIFSPVLVKPGVTPLVCAIIEASKSPGEGEIGDGKIFVTAMIDLARVRTNERGEAAL